MNNSPQRAAKGFTRAFWVSNTVELFERMAYYAVFIVLTIYLSSILGFNDFEASMISGLFSGGLYLLPIFSGAYADKIGFRKSMIIAFSLLSIGYLGLGVLPTLLEAAGLVSYGATTQFNGLPDSYTRWIIVPVWLVMVPLLNLMVCLIAIPGGSSCRFCLYLWWEVLSLSPLSPLLWLKKQRKQPVPVVIPYFI